MGTVAPETTAVNLSKDSIHANGDSAGYDRAIAVSSLFGDGQVVQALINRLALLHSHQRSYSWPLVNIDSEGAN